MKRGSPEALARSLGALSFLCVSCGLLASTTALAGMFCAVAIPLCDVIVHCCDLRSGASLKLSAVSPPPLREREPEPAQPSASLSSPRPSLRGSRTPRHRIIVCAGPSGSPSLPPPRPCTFHPAPAPPRTISMRCKHERQEEEEGPHLGRGCPPGRCDRSFVRAGPARPVAVPGASRGGA